MNWKSILDEATQLLSGGAGSDAGLDEQRHSGETLGQVAVLVQTFRGIPIQVKVTDPDGETRIALDARFSNAAQLIQTQSGADYLKERYWADWGVRYGTKEEVAAEVAEEIHGTLGEKELTSLMANALGKSDEQEAVRAVEAIRTDLASDDWHKRLVAVQDIGTSEDAVPLLIKALKDSHPQVRRLVAAALGASGNPSAVAPLADALIEDASIAVRRTAGDALSDLGDVSAQAAVCKALADPNKLVRWRAARFLADAGTDESLPFLKQVSDDPEFEVRLEVQAAIERISGGKEGSMPAWKKILKNTSSP
jgi:HEAT repeat protein